MSECTSCKAYPSQNVLPAYQTSEQYGKMCIRKALATGMEDPVMLIATNHSSDHTLMSGCRIALAYPASCIRGNSRFMERSTARRMSSGVPDT